MESSFQKMTPFIYLLALIGGVLTTQIEAVFYFPERVASQIVASLKPTPFEFFFIPNLYCPSTGGDGEFDN
jgi:hypothetical protein